jgi:2-methylcitrate dehydratase PrpD
MGATSVLARFAAETPSDRIPEDARAAARRHLLDCVGVALAASAEPPGRMVAEMVREAGGTPEARLLVSGIRTSALQASWGNGALAHLLDYDDTGFSHPTACIMPAALAVAERRRASGRDLVAALVVGYEVFERLSLSGRSHEPALRARGYHPTSLYGCPAAAAAAGRLLGLDGNQMGVALGLAAANAGGLTQHFGTWGKGVHAGNAARAGVTGALLAAKGYWCDGEVLEGPYGFFNAIHGKGNFDLGRIEDRLGEQWAIVDPGLTIKSYPACGGVLRAVDAAIALRQEHRIAFDQVERVEVETHPDLLNTLRFVAPSEGFRGKFSLDYCVAAAVLDGRVDLASFTDAQAQSARMRDALARVTVVQHPEWSGSAFDRRRNPVTIHLKDGRSVRKEVEHPRGSLRNPMMREELLGKYRGCARRALSPEQVERSIAVLEDVEKVDDVRALVDALIATPPKA